MDKMIFIYIVWAICTCVAVAGLLYSFIKESEQGAGACSTGLFVLAWIGYELFFN